MNVERLERIRNCIFLLIWVLVFLQGTIADEIQKDSEYDLDEKLGKVELKGKNVEVKKEGGLTEIYFQRNGFIETNVGGKINRYEGFATAYDGIQGGFKEGKLVFDQNGNLVEAVFTAAESKTYNIKGYEIFLQKGVDFYYKDGKIVIDVYANSEIKEPKKIDPNALDVEFKFKGPSNSPKILENGDEFLGTLKYNLNGWYSDEDFEIGGMKAEGVELEVYFDFNGEVNKKFPGVYFSYNKKSGKAVFGTNSKEDSPEWIFQKDNSFGMKVESGITRSYYTGKFGRRYYKDLEIKDYTSVKVKGDTPGSYLEIANLESQGVITQGKVVGSLEISQDGKVFPFDNNHFSIQDLDTHADTSAIPMDLEVYKLSNGKETPVLRKNQRLIIGNSDWSDSSVRFVVTDTPGYSLSNDDYGISEVTRWGEDVHENLEGLYHGVSNRLTYNYPDVENLKKFTGVDLTINNYYKKTLENDPSKMRMIIDVFNFAEGSVKEGLEYFHIGNRAYLGYSFNGGLAVDKKMSFAVEKLRPSILLHELIHTGTLEDEEFIQDWKEIRGQYDTVAEGGYTSDYGEARIVEDIAEYSYAFLENSENNINRLKGDDGIALNSADEKLFAAKSALFITRNKFSGPIKEKTLSEFREAGISTEIRSLEKMISEVKKWSGDATDYELGTAEFRRRHGV